MANGNLYYRGLLVMVVALIAKVIWSRRGYVISSGDSKDSSNHHLDTLGGKAKQHEVQDLSKLVGRTVEENKAFKNEFTQDSVEAFREQMYALAHEHCNGVLYNGKHEEFRDLALALRNEDLMTEVAKEFLEEEKRLMKELEKWVEDTQKQKGIDEKASKAFQTFEEAKKEKREVEKTYERLVEKLDEQERLETTKPEKVNWIKPIQDLAGMRFSSFDSAGNVELYRWVKGWAKERGTVCDQGPAPTPLTLRFVLFTKTGVAMECQFNHPAASAVFIMNSKEMGHAKSAGVGTPQPYKIDFWGLPPTHVTKSLQSALAAIKMEFGEDSGANKLPMHPRVKGAEGGFPNFFNTLSYFLYGAALDADLKPVLQAELQPVLLAWLKAIFEYNGLPKNAYLADLMWSIVYL